MKKITTELNQEDFMPENFEEIKSKISNLKIADKLSDKNPLKAFLFLLENSNKPGFIYKTISLCIAFYYITLQLLGFLNNMDSFFILLPFSILIMYFILTYFNKKTNNNDSLRDCIFNPKSTEKIYILFFVCMLITTLLTNENGNQLHLLTTLSTFNNLYVYLNFNNNLGINYTILSCLVIIVLTSSNNIYAIYERIIIRYKLGINNPQIAFSVFMLITMLAIIILPLIYNEIFIANSKLITISILILIFCIFYISISFIFFIFFISLRILASFINKFI